MALPVSAFAHVAEEHEVLDVAHGGHTSAAA